jgi:flagellin-like protein
MIRDSMKAISPIVAIIVVFLITIAFAGAGWSFISNYWSLMFSDQKNGFNLENNGTTGTNIPVVSSEWNTPINIGPPVNTAGWEDSVSISPDGNELYFSYGNYDFITFVITGGVKNNIGPNRGMNEVDLGDIMVSYKTGNDWSNPVLANNINEAFALDDGAFTQDGITFYSSGLKAGNTGGPSSSDIYMSSRASGIWSVPVNLGSPVNTEYSESNPWISTDDDLLLFDSDRPGSSDRDIWMAEKVAGVWQAPVKFGTPINSPGEETHPFLTQDQQTMYFSSNRDGILKIYKSDRLNAATWDEPQVIISGEIGVGEPTLTSDGKYIYFVNIHTPSVGSYEGEIYFSERKT